MAKVIQRLYSRRVDDVVGETKRQLERLGIAKRLKGKRIAITAGSRGIARIAEIIKGVVEFVRFSGGEPFLFPAMGSHGGGRQRKGRSPSCGTTASPKNSSALPS